MSLPLLLGGVRASEFWRVVLVVLNTLLLSLSMGLLISTLFRRQRVTTHLAALLMLMLALVPFGVGSFLRAVGAAPTSFLDPSALSPVYSLQTAFDSAYGLAGLIGSSFWAAFLVLFALSILLLARASWLLPDSWQQSASQVASDRERMR
jgi:ABC-type multidrug transport system permease subunit